MLFFDSYPEFILNDSRSKRQTSTVTAESLTNRHEVLLSKSVIQGCSILDLGSCYGATGHWCLANGASYYTGVEIQPDMVEKSNEMLSKYWNNFTITNIGIDDFLNNTKEKYDIVIVFGVLYAFLNQYDLLKRISKITNKMIVVDTIYPRKMTSSEDSIIEVITNQHINSSIENTAYVGAGASISPAALKIMLKSLEFEDSEGVIYPKRLVDKSVHDSYNMIVNRGDSHIYKQLPMRYLMRFTKGKSGLKPVSEIVESNDIALSTDMHNKPKIVSKRIWEFDDAVANRYDSEASKHIPDYQRVIDLCVSYVNQDFKKSAAIIDVGSANGNTVDRFLSEGYTNVYGVECSKAMHNVSKHQDRIIFSEEFPDKEWDVVLANWVLHFMQDRREYLQKIYDNMKQDGLLILSDKMEFTQAVEIQYDEFKRANGVLDFQIKEKKQALIGVLTTKPCKWYLDTLQEIGFKDIQIVNASLMFNTLYARK